MTISKTTANVVLDQKWKGYNLFSHEIRSYCKTLYIK